MDLREYLRLLRLRWRLIAACTVAAVAAAASFSLTKTPIYEASAQLFVSAASDQGVGSAYTGSLFTQQRVKSYAKFVDSPEVTTAVVRQLELRETPAELAGKISADAPLDTVLINVHVRDTEPADAQRIANAVSAQFGKLVNSIEAPDANTASPVKIAVVRPAGLPGSPVEPRTKLNIVLGLLVGLAIGIGLAVAREILDTRVRTPAEIEERFKLATLAVIGFDPGAKSKPLIVQDATRSTRAESFRRLRTNLQFVDVDKRPRSIVVTSALPGEGKTTTACNLAITLAGAGVPVILVDSDLRKPAVAEYLGIEQAIGLTNVLIGQVALEDALQPWGRTGRLLVLPSGVLPPNPSELLGSHQMMELIATLEDRALVLLDAPPLLPVTDAAVIAAEASGALLVVRAKHTRREHVATALGNLSAVGAHVLGSVLNMAPTRGPDAYTYGYGYYGSYAANTAPESFPSVVPPRGVAVGAGPDATAAPRDALPPRSP